MTIRVGIADDQAMIRNGFRLQVQYTDDLELVGEASNGEQAVSLARSQAPDVLLMDVRMPVMDGIEATRRISADPELAGVRVLVLTTFDLDEHVYDALRAGASGFLLKNSSPEDLIDAIRVVARGDALLDPAVTRRVIESFASSAVSSEAASLDALTPRERDVLVLVARGLSNAEIAAELLLGTGTIKTHVAAILSKLGLRDRTQAAILAYECGLVRPGRAPT
jgi:DNA-binding NarL/FixJ family response regulator